VSATAVAVRAGEGARGMALLLGAVRPHLAPALVDDGAFTRITRASRFFPPLSGAILECRLAEGDGDADLSLRLLAADGGRERFGRTADDPPVPAAWLRATEWRRVDALCRAWADARSPLHEHVETLWLEFDGPTLARAVPRPCVFFSTPALDAGPLHALIGDALEVLLGAPPSSATRASLRRCLDALPDGAGLAFVGVMLARATGSVRVCLRMRAGEVMQYLVAVGWNHPTAQVAWVLEQAAPLPAAEVVLTLDVGETILPTVGIEVRADPSGEWGPILGRLVTLGLCAPHKARAALRWPGCDAVLRGLTPADITLRPPSTARAAAGALQARTLNHLKLVTHPGRPPVAKAYFYAGFVWPAGTIHPG
jgi:hypothetical protein